MPYIVGEDVLKTDWREEARYWMVIDGPLLALLPVGRVEFIQEFGEFRVLLLEGEVLGEWDQVDNIIASEARVNYYIYPEEVARRRFYFPGHENFYFQ